MASFSPTLAEDWKSHHSNDAGDGEPSTTFFGHLTMALRLLGMFLTLLNLWDWGLHLLFFGKLVSSMTWNLTFASIHACHPPQNWPQQGPSYDFICPFTRLLGNFKETGSKESRSTNTAPNPWPQLRNFWRKVNTMILHLTDALCTEPTSHYMRALHSILLQVNSFPCIPWTHGNEVMLKLWT